MHSNPWACVLAVFYLQYLIDACMHVVWISFEALVNVIYLQTLSS